jgi:hypothetical protein
MTTAWLLTIDGCPYAAGSADCPSTITSSDSDLPAGVVVIPGALCSEKLRALSWSEDIKPTTGELSVGQITLALDDELATSGPASGERVWTWLFSRRPREILNVSLASPGISASATSIVVLSDPGFSNVPQTIWIDREAIRCSGFNAGTKTFTATARGYLGTRAASHYVDESNAFTPTVWAEFPNPQRRRAILWMVVDGVASPVWRGYLGRAPRLDAEGSRWEVQLDHAWSVQQNRALGPSRQSVRIVGFQPESLRVMVLQTGFAGATINAFEVLREPYPQPWPRSQTDLASILVERINAMFRPAYAGSPLTGFVRATVSDGRLRFETRLDTTHTLFVGPRPVSGRVVLPSPSGEQSTATERTVGAWTAIASLPYAATAHVMLRNGESNEVPVDSVAGIPTSSLSTTTTADGLTTRVQWALSDTTTAGGWHIALDSVDGTNRTVTGVLRPQWIGWAGGVTLANPRSILLTEPLDVALVTRVESTHWVGALRYGALAQDYGIDDQADPRDWDWTSVPRVIGATGGEYTTSRVWLFDGSAKLGEFVKDACRLDVCALGLRGSRLSFESIDPPLDTEDADYTLDLTAGQGVHKSTIGWTTLPEGIVNVVRITRESGPSLTVNNQTSIARYGLSNALEIEAKGAIATALDGRTPFELARGPLSRALGMWGEPCELLAVDAPITALVDAELCSIVALTSKTIPDGEGHRGVSTTRRGRVMGRNIDFGRGVVRLSVLVYPHRVSGYAPAFRVDGFGAPSNRKVSITAAAFSGTTATNYAGTSSSAGVELMNVGDVMRFRKVDDTSGTEEDEWVVESVDPAGPSITLIADPSGGAIDWPNELAFGATLELVACNYNATGIVATQKQYTYVGDDTTLAIDGEPLKEWAP